MIYEPSDYTTDVATRPVIELLAAFARARHNAEIEATKIGDASMRAGGRRWWNDADQRAALAEMDRLLGGVS